MIVGELRMICEGCKGKEFRLVWYKALIEEDKPINIYQCKQCKRIVLCTTDCEYSDYEV